VSNLSKLYRVFWLLWVS